MQFKIKILTIIYDLEVGGTQRAAQNFAMAYHLDGHDSRVLTIYGDGPRMNQLLNAGIFVYSQNNGEEENLAEINDWHPDIIHIHRWGNSDTHLGKILYNLKNKNTKVIETNVFSWADNSDDSKLIDVHCHLSEWCIWRWSLFVKNKPLGIVLPYLVIPDNFYKESRTNIDSFKTRHKIPLDKFVFGRIGQNSPAKFHKNIYLSFESLFLINKNIHLFMVGVPPLLMPEIEALLSYQKGGITLLEKIEGDEELRLAYNSMDCFLHYSTIGESFGMVLAEAQLCEVPIISVSTPKADNSQLEVIKHNESGIIVKNDKYLLEVMAQFLGDTYSLIKFGEAGRKHVLDNFIAAAMIPRLNILFSMLVRNEHTAINISQYFKSNLKEVSIRHLEQRGYGELNFTSKLFLFLPKQYTMLAHYTFMLKQKLKKIL